MREGEGGEGKEGGGRGREITNFVRGGALNSNSSTEASSKFHVTSAQLQVLATGTTGTK